MSKAPAQPISKFLDDYLLYNAGNEVPMNYHRFAILALAGALLECRVWFSWEYATYTPNLYVGLIGPQGLRKSTAASIAHNTLKAADPDHPFAMSAMSKESLIKKMARPESKKSFDQDGKLIVYEPLTWILYEMKHSLAINPSALVDWLTHVYDGSDSSSETIKRSEEKVERPSLTLLACETTDWIVDRLRQNLISGGFSRRLLYVIEDDYPERVAQPKVPKGGYEALERVKKRMTRMKTLTGLARFAPKASDWYVDWYNNVKPPPSKFGRAWYSSKHVQLIKLAMILAAADDGTLVLEVKHLKGGLALLDSIEKRMFTLVAMSGRNPLVAPSFALLGELEKAPMPEHKARRFLFEWAGPREVEELLRHMQQVRDIKIERNEAGHSMVVLGSAAKATAGS